MFKKFAILCVAASPYLAFSDEARWSGAYAGLNAGYQWSHAETNLEPTGYWTTRSDAFARSSVQTLREGGSRDLNPEGYPLGLQGGYNYQINNYVFGIEADFDYAGLHKNNQTGYAVLAPGLSSDTVMFKESVRNNWTSTLRARFGYSTDKFLGYVTGGLAYGNYRVSSSYTIYESPTYYSATASSSKNLLGWVLGAGLEYSLTKHWALRGEYLYFKYQNLNMNSLVAGTPSVEAMGYTNHHSITNINSQTLRVGINYRF